MPSAIGKKDQRIVIRQGTETADAEGQPVTVWNELVTVWADAIFLSGRELEAMQKINAEISLKFITASRRDVTEKMQVQWRSPVSAVVDDWNVNSIMPLEDRFNMALLCSKVE